jgi:branched-chain amino acid transport system substrate-binding protein
VPVVGSFIDPRVTVGEDGKPQAAMFLMQPSSVQYSEIMASYTIDLLGLRKVGVLYDKSNAFAVSLMKPYVEYIKAAGGEIVRKVYTKGTSTSRPSSQDQEAAPTAVLPKHIQEAVLVTTIASRSASISIIGGLDSPALRPLENDPEGGQHIPANNFSEKEPSSRKSGTSTRQVRRESREQGFLGRDLLIRDA